LFSTEPTIEVVLRELLGLFHLNHYLLQIVIVRRIQALEMHLMIFNFLNWKFHGRAKRKDPNFSTGRN